MSSFPENSLVSQRVQQFDVEHSQDGPGIRDGGFIIYSDGAYRDSNPMGVLADAVADRWVPNDLERKRLRYWEVATKRAEDTFNDKREEWLRAAKTAKTSRYAQPPPTSASEAANELKQLKADVQAKRRKLEQARKAFKKVEGEFYWQKQESADRQSVACQTFIETVAEIKV